jgi:8-oxo-dGTP pyrophosphatase MutT (NUDIX family)
MSSTYNPNHKEIKVYARVGCKVIIQERETQKILVLRRSAKCSRAGGWDFAGGGLDLGEEPAKGAIREALEETGLQLTAVKAIEIRGYMKDDEYFVMMGYLASIPAVIDIQLSWEHDAYQWVSLEEANALEWPETHKRFLDSL